MRAVERTKDGLIISGLSEADEALADKAAIAVASVLPHTMGVMVVVVRGTPGDGDIHASCFDRLLDHRADPMAVSSMLVRTVTEFIDRRRRSAS